MKIFIYLTVLLSHLDCLFAQTVDTIVLQKNTPNKEIYLCLWGDSRFMEPHPNGKLFRFKEGLSDGMYIAFYKNILSSDTAMVAVIDNGKLNGLLSRWDQIDYNLAEECEYSNGKISGYRKLYLVTPEGKRLVNIEYWINGIHDKDIIREW